MSDIRQVDTASVAVEEIVARALARADVGSPFGELEGTGAYENAVQAAYVQDRDGWHQAARAVLCALREQL